MIDYFEYLFKKFNSSELSSDLFSRVIYNFIYLGCILQNLTNSSEIVSTLFHQCSKNGLKILVNLLTISISNIEIYLNMHELKSYYVELILGSLNNLSIVAYNFKSMWTELGKISMYYEWSKKYGQMNKTCKILPYFIIANIATDEDLKNITNDFDHIIQEIVLKVKSMANQLKNPRLVKRTEIYLNENLKNIISDSNGFNLNEVS